MAGYNHTIMFKKGNAQCPRCYSKNVNEEKHDEQDSPDFEGLRLIPIMILCRDCKWGFNIIGTKKVQGKKTVK